MNKIIKILMDRDDMSYDEAKSLVEETREEVLESNPFEAEDIMADYLGLEPDYIIDLFE